VSLVITLNAVTLWHCVEWHYTEYVNVLLNALTLSLCCMSLCGV
jgi:hypothetical protein